MPLSFSEIDQIVSTGRTPTIDGGRVTTLLPEDYETARSVRIIDAPDAGHLTVNPDNSLALVMTGSGYQGALSFTVEIVDAAGRTSRETIDLRATATAQEAGWGTSLNHYMLETDAQGELIIETGEIHRDVYVSGSNDALTIADIAALEGLSRSAITGNWLANNSEYGANPGMALSPDAGIVLWQALTREQSTSHWLRFEKGYVYTEGEIGSLFTRGANGESPLHPMVITSYGSGAQPVIDSYQFLSRDSGSNTVVHDVHFTERVSAVGFSEDAGNIIVDSITSTEEGELVFQNLQGVTVRNSDFYDVGRESPLGGGDWEASRDRLSGLFGQDIEGMLIEDSTFADIAWGEGYDFNGDGNFPQAPSMFSHNVYMSSRVSDMTFRDNISSQAASFGAQLRSGGFIEDNLFLDNNAGLTVQEGDSSAGLVGAFSLLSGNVVTSAAYKQAALIGGLSIGISNGGRDTALVDNIVAHLTDPDQPSELAEKYYNNGAVNHVNDPFFDNTVIFGWHSGREAEIGQARIESLWQNVDGLNPTVLNNTTGANLAKLVLNDPRAGIDDLVDWMKVNEVDADTLLAYFKDPFGLLQNERQAATDVRFIPNEIGDGVRWDNRINWSTEDLPIAGDRVDLGGNWVVHSGTNTINRLDFGSGGELAASNGRLNVTGQVTAGAEGATLTLSSAGQVWFGGGYGGTNAALQVDMDGGRFANTGTILGNVNVSIDDGQALLSANGGDFILGNGETLTVRGADAKVGFDGIGNREGVIRFEGNSNVVLASDTSGLGSIGEFRSGAYNNAPQVDSNIYLGGASLSVDLRSAWQSNGTYTLMSADEITGTLGGFSIQGLGSRAATLTINYNTDAVMLELGSGSGVTTRTIGDGGNTPPPPVDDNPPPPDDSGTGGGSGGGGTGGGSGGGGTGGVPGSWTVAELDALTSDLYVFVQPGSVPAGYDYSFDNTIQGSEAANTLTGTLENDKVFASAGNDIVRARDGHDLVWGGTGDDQIFGNYGNDIIFAAENEDIVDGGFGNDLIAGAHGLDILFGNDGDDNINGGAGSDRIEGGHGADILTGGWSNDLFVFTRSGADWNDIITDFQVGRDQLQLGDAAGGYLDLDDIRVDDYRGNAVLTQNGNYILLQDVSVETVINNADSIFRSATSAPLPVDDLEPVPAPSPAPAPAPSPAPTPEPEPEPAPAPAPPPAPTANLVYSTTGNDDFQGTSGTDVFIFNSDSQGGFDTISNFDFGVDLLAVSDGAGGYRNADDFNIWGNHNYTSINYNGTRITLENVSKYDVLREPELVFDDGSFSDYFT